MFRLYLEVLSSVRQSVDPSDAVVFAEDSPFSRVCMKLHESKCVNFIVSGFGQEWPVDVWLDMLIFIEQLPDMVAWLDKLSAQEFELSFYEQGLSRYLTLFPVDDYILIKCQSGTDWVPFPEEEVLDRAALISMIEGFRSSLLSAIRIVCPDENDHPEVQKWFNETTIKRT